MEEHRQEAVIRQNDVRHENILKELEETSSQYNAKRKALLNEKLLPDKRRRLNDLIEEDTSYATGAAVEFKVTVAIESKMDRFLTSQDKLQKLVESVKKEIEAVKKQTTNSNTQMNGLKDDVKNLKDDVKNLNKRVEKLGKKVLTKSHMKKLPQFVQDLSESPDSDDDSDQDSDQDSE